MRRGLHDFPCHCDVAAARRAIEENIARPLGMSVEQAAWGIRTILDSNGAEQLLGKGDMLYLPPASSRHIRLHGPYISEQESARLASFLRKQGKPTYDMSITAEEKPEGVGPNGATFDKDELFDEAARIVVSSGQASISYLQRRLRIGFSRAARLIDMMELDGIVSPATNGKREAQFVPDIWIVRGDVR